MPSPATGQKFLKLLSELKRTEDELSELKRAEDELSTLKRTDSAGSVKGSPGVDGSGRMKGAQEGEGERGNDGVRERIRTQLEEEALSNGLGIGGKFQSHIWEIGDFE